MKFSTVLTAVFAATAMAAPSPLEGEASSPLEKRQCTSSCYASCNSFYLDVCRRACGNTTSQCYTNCFWSNYDRCTNCCAKCRTC